jgi:hypothetical protein
MIRTALTADERIERMRSNILTFDGPRLSPFQGFRGVVSICGYGPSLADTWGNTIGPVMTTSGAHDFLLARGVIPTYHVETDPREHKAWLMNEPHPDVHYLINSQCHPNMFAKLAGFHVTMWHGCTDDDAERQIALVENLEPRARLLNGGTNVGIRAIPVARELGHTHFELHGMDCSYRGIQQWAGGHVSQRVKTVLVEVEGETFETSDVMMQSTDDLFNTMRMMPNCRFRVHGGGLLEARLKLFNSNPQKALSVDWWKPINFTLRAA